MSTNQHFQFICWILNKMNTTDVIYYMLASFKIGVSTPRIRLQMYRSSEKNYTDVFFICALLGLKTGMLSKMHGKNNSILDFRCFSWWFLATEGSVELQLNWPLQPTLKYLLHLLENASETCTYSDVLNKAIILI